YILNQRFKLGFIETLAPDMIEFDVQAFVRTIEFFERNIEAFFPKCVDRRIAFFKTRKSLAAFVFESRIFFCLEIDLHVKVHEFHHRDFRLERFYKESECHGKHSILLAPIPQMVDRDHLEAPVATDAVKRSPERRRTQMVNVQRFSNIGGTEFQYPASA